ncbi:hypothetical protein L2E82_37530 [Cichorium intybus]|uniref:Uncharacterized protein n=1 Tax=Cichorium intybus TaxID=13427 RepID=A0ACB9ADZ5_CICIN|nr:hypothetical protein L2E82_37530 [Cichorium intybus]
MTKRLILCLNRVLVEKIVPPSKTTADILLPEKSSKLENHHTNTWGASAILHPSCRVCQHLFFFHDTHLSMHNCR